MLEEKNHTESSRPVRARLPGDKDDALLAQLGYKQGALTPSKFRSTPVAHGHGIGQNSKEFSVLSKYSGLASV